MTCIFYVNKSNPVPKKTIPSFWDAPTHWWDFKSHVLKRQPPRHEYNIKRSHHLNSIVILKVLELKSNMYAAIVVFFASIVGVNSLSIHKRSCSVTIDSDFAVNKVSYILFYIFFFNVWKVILVSNVHMDCSITCNSNETFSLKKICKMQN